MSGTLQQDNETFAPPIQATIPRMVGDSDVHLLEKVCARLPQDPILLEFGPFLGGVTTILANFGHVHVVDRFEWSALNDQAYQGMLAPGGSFRPTFEENMRQRGCDITTHEADFKDFSWTGGAIDLVYLDAPRAGPLLYTCLSSLKDGWHPQTRFVIKNGLNPEYPSLLAYIEILLGAGVFVLDQTDQPVWNSSLSLFTGPTPERLKDLRPSKNLFTATPLAPDVRDPWDGRRLSTARLAERVQYADWKGALSLLAQAPQDTEYLYSWDRVEAALDLMNEDAIWPTVFAELLAEQVDPQPGQFNTKTSVSWALRGWWKNNAGQSWQVSDFHPDLIALAFENHNFQWPGTLLDEIKGKSVLEIGSNLGLSAVSYCAEGCTRYLGAELNNLNASSMQIEAAISRATFLPIRALEKRDLQEIDLVVFDQDAVRGNDILEETFEAIDIKLRSDVRVIVRSASPQKAQLVGRDRIKGILRPKGPS